LVWFGKDIHAVDMDKHEEKIEQVQVNLRFGLERSNILWTWINP
jgi:hypothetical protein